MVGEQREPVRMVRGVHVLEVGLVEHHHHVARNAGEERLDLVAGDAGAGRVVRVGHEHDARRGVDRLRHGRQVVAVVPGRDPHHLAAGGGDGERIDDEGVRVDHAPVAGAHEHPGEQLEDVVGAVAQRDGRGGHAETLGEGALELEAAAVRIAAGLAHGPAHGVLHGLAGATRVLVARELHGLAHAELPFEFLHRLARPVGLEGPHGGSGTVEHGGDGRVSGHASSRNQSTARG